MFDMEMEGFEEIGDEIESASDEIIAETEEGSRAYAEYLLRRIQESAPVETGEYRNNWRIEKRTIDGDETTVIVNDTEHGKYLVFPNQKMVGSQSADDPAAGIVHNVRGIVKASEEEYKSSILERLKALLS